MAGVTSSVEWLADYYQSVLGEVLLTDLVSVTDSSQSLTSGSAVQTSVSGTAIMPVSSIGTSYSSTGLSSAASSPASSSFSSATGAATSFTASPTDVESETHKILTDGAIAGIAVAAVLVIGGILTLALCCCWIRRRNRRRHNQVPPAMQMQNQGQDQSQYGQLAGGAGAGQTMQQTQQPYGGQGYQSVPQQEGGAYRPPQAGYVGAGAAGDSYETKPFTDPGRTMSPPPPGYSVTEEEVSTHGGSPPVSPPVDPPTAPLMGAAVPNPAAHEVSGDVYHRHSGLSPAPTGVSEVDGTSTRLNNPGISELGAAEGRFGNAGRYGGGGQGRMGTVRQGRGELHELSGTNAGPLDDVYELGDHR